MLSRQTEEFIIQAAPRHTSVKNAPSSLEALRSVQRMTGCIPVSDANSTRTIYSRPMYNYAFRAWHDMLHVVSGEVFDIHGELAVASLQDHILRLANIPEPDIAAIYADTAGQAHYYSIHGNFPMDQRGFVLAYVTHGAEHALHTWRDSVNG